MIKMLYIENARANFSTATDSFCKSARTPEVVFYHKFANMIPDRLDVDTLILALKIALQDAEREGVNTFPFITIIYLYVRQFSSSEFAHEFRLKYLRNVLSVEIADLPEVDYGYNKAESSESIIDISNKDPYEVFAALYNASAPVGMGFDGIMITEVDGIPVNLPLDDTTIQELQGKKIKVDDKGYNPMTMTPAIAKEYFRLYEQEHGSIETVHTGWVKGRPLKLTFFDNLTRVFVAYYNNNSEFGLAQRVIATCRNIEKGKIRNNKNSETIDGDHGTPGASHLTKKLERKG